MEGCTSLPRVHLCLSWQTNLRQKLATMHMTMLLWKAMACRMRLGVELAKMACMLEPVFQAKGTYFFLTTCT